MLIILKIGTILVLMWLNHPIYSSYTRIMESISGTSIWNIALFTTYFHEKTIPNSNFFNQYDYLIWGEKINTQDWKKNLL